MDQVPPHFHKDYRVEERDLIPDPTVYQALPVSGAEGERAMVDDGVIVQFFRMVRGAWKRIGMEFPSLGAAGQVLRVNGGGNGLEFADLSTTDPYALGTQMYAYHTIVLPFTCYNSDPVGVPAGWKQAGVDSGVSEWHGGYMKFKSNTSSAYVYVNLPGPNTTNNSEAIFGDGKILIGEWRATYSGGGARCWGFETSSTGLYTYNYASGHSAIFGFNGTNLYARTSDGSTATLTQITGVTVSDWNTYKIVIDLANGNVKFYVNNVLKATHTTHLPSLGNMKFGCGLDTNGMWLYMTQAVISQQQ